MAKSRAPPCQPPRQTFSLRHSQVLPTILTHFFRSICVVSKLTTQILEIYHAYTKFITKTLISITVVIELCSRFCRRTVALFRIKRRVKPRVSGMTKYHLRNVSLFFSRSLLHKFFLHTKFTTKILIAITMLLRIDRCVKACVSGIAKCHPRNQPGGSWWFRGTQALPGVVWHRGGPLPPNHAGLLYYSQA